MLNLIRLLTPQGKLSSHKSLVVNSYRYFAGDIAQSFKSRSRLTEFYKYTHPDILANAPERVKEENLRSIKILNNYLDGLNKNSGVVEQHLKFYIAEKSTQKNKKFFFFEITLTPLKPGASPELLEKHTHNLVQNLLGSLKETRIKTNPLLKQEAIKDAVTKDKPVFGEEEDGTVDLYTLKQRDKKSTMEDYLTKNHRERDTLQAIIDYKMYNDVKQGLRDKIDEKIFVNTGASARKGFLNQLVEKDADKYVKQFSVYALNPHFVYFAEDLSEEDSKNFLQKIMQTKDKTPDQISELRNLQQLGMYLNSNDPPIYILVSNDYSIKDIPGYISIPHNYKHQEATEYLTNNIANALEERDAYLENVRRAEELCTAVSNNSLFKKVILAQSKMANNQQIETSMLCLKRLLRFFTQNWVSPSFKEKFRHLILNIDNEFGYQKSSLSIPYNYKDAALLEFLKGTK